MSVPSLTSNNVAISCIVRIVALFVSRKASSISENDAAMFDREIEVAMHLREEADRLALRLNVRHNGFWPLTGLKTAQGTVRNESSGPLWLTTF